MTFGLKSVVGAFALRRGDTTSNRGFFGTQKPLFGETWQETILCPGLLEGRWTLADVWIYTWGAHASHLLDFSAAMLCYWLFYSNGTWLKECQEWKVGCLVLLRVTECKCM